MKKTLRSAVITHEDFWPDTPEAIEAVQSYCAAMQEVCNTMTTKMVSENKAKFPNLTESEIRSMVGKFQFQVQKMEWNL